MNTLETIEKLKIFLTKQINNLAMTNPMISFSKPLILRIINNNIYKVSNFLSMVADENGNIDVQTLIPEMIQSVMTTQPFTFDTGFLGELEIGGGFIKMNIPMTKNQIVFGRNDLDMLREIFLENRS